MAQTAFDTGVTKIINVGAKLDSSRRAVQIAREIPFCFAAVGIHPHHAEEFPDLDYVRQELEKIIEEDKNNGGRIVAIGECGLDYHEYNVGIRHGEPHGAHNCVPLQKMQINLLKVHIYLAKKYHLPLTFHCRDAYSDLLDLLRDRYRNLSLRGVIHCFQGSLEDLKQFLDLGFYIGYDGYITYPDKFEIRNSTCPPVADAPGVCRREFETRLAETLAKRANSNNQNSKQKICVNQLSICVNPGIQKQKVLTRYEELVKNTPFDRLLTETDSPWLTPEPFRGKRNTPANVKIICEKIGEIKSATPDKINKITTENASRLFSKIAEP